MLDRYTFEPRRKRAGPVHRGGDAGDRQMVHARKRHGLCRGRWRRQGRVRAYFGSGAGSADEPDRGATRRHAGRRDAKRTSGRIHQLGRLKSRGGLLGRHAAVLVKLDGSVRHAHPSSQLISEAQASACPVPALARKACRRVGPTDFRDSMRWSAIVAANIHPIPFGCPQLTKLK